MSILLNVRDMCMHPECLSIVQVHNFRSVTEMYKWSSSIFYLENITTPMVFINALDDPIVPEMLLNPIKEHASEYNCEKPPQAQRRHRTFLIHGN